MNLVRDQLYCVENTEAGRFIAKLSLVSLCQKSLLFRFPEPVGLRVSGGVIVADWLALCGTATGYEELHTGALWTISEPPPATQ